MAEFFSGRSMAMRFPSPRPKIQPALCHQLRGRPGALGVERLTVCRAGACPDELAEE